MKARSPDKFMDVTRDAKLTHENDFLSHSMMIKAQNVIMKERIWIKRVAQRRSFCYLKEDQSEF